MILGDVIKALEILEMERDLLGPFLIPLRERTLGGDDRFILIYGIFLGEEPDHPKAEVVFYDSFAKRPLGEAFQ